MENSHTSVISRELLSPYLLNYTYFKINNKYIKDIYSIEFFESLDSEEIKERSEYLIEF